MCLAAVAGDHWTLGKTLEEAPRTIKYAEGRCDVIDEGQIEAAAACKAAGGKCVGDINDVLDHRVEANKMYKAWRGLLDCTRAVAFVVFSFRPPAFYFTGMHAAPDAA